MRTNFKFNFIAALLMAFCVFSFTAFADPVDSKSPDKSATFSVFDSPEAVSTVPTIFAFPLVNYDGAVSEPLDAENPFDDYNFNPLLTPPVFPQLNSPQPSARDNPSKINQGIVFAARRIPRRE